MAPVGALEAARSFAVEHELPVGEPTILRDGSNLIVHLRPAPVIVRIATMTAEVRGDPLPHLAREVQLVSYLASVGAPVMPPSDLVPPGPYVVGGWALSAWQYIAHEPPATPDVRSAFAALDELHQAMVGFRPELPLLNPAVDDFDRALRFAIDRGLIDSPAGACLVERRDAFLADLLAMSPDVQPLHGDAFARNALRTAAGIVWLDFEDCCSGPAVWDLATLVRRDRDPGVVAEIERRHGPAALAAAIALRAVQVEPWGLIHADRAGARA